MTIPRDTLWTKGNGGDFTLVSRHLVLNAVAQDLVLTLRCWLDCTGSRFETAFINTLIFLMRIFKIRFKDLDTKIIEYILIHCFCEADNRGS